MKFSLLASASALLFSLATASPLPDTSPRTDILARAVPGPVVNDYPWKGDCGPAEKYGYYKCQCTSFVAWRINERLGIAFTNYYQGAHWGNADTWGEAARATGHNVNQNPKPGAIAHYNGGSAGHVAWVVSVSGDNVRVEEYNWANPEAYGTRTVAASSFTNFIHL